MNKLSIGLLALTTLIIPATWAESDDTDSSQFYAGAKIGMLDISRSIPFEDGTMLGFVFGFDIPDTGFALEGEFNTTIDKAESTNPSYSDLGVTTLAGYGVYRTSGQFYLKGKFGFLYEYLTSSVKGAGTKIDVDGPGVAISYGIGAGVRIGDQLSAEIEYTSIEADIGYTSLGVNLEF